MKCNKKNKLKMFNDKINVCFFKKMLWVELAEQFLPNVFNFSKFSIIEIEKRAILED